MDINFFTSFFQLKLVNIYDSAEDFFDRLNYKFTNAILILMVMFVGVRQYIFSPIECWIPHEWSDAWQEYAENFCWVENTYYADVGEGPPEDLGKRDRLRINYYQWVPFVLAIQCLGFYLPHHIWQVLGNHVVGSQFSYIIKFAVEAVKQTKEESRDRLTKYIAIEISKSTNAKRADFSSKRKFFSPFRKVFFCFGKRSGYALIFIYFLTKVLYLANCVGQIFLMKSFIQADSLTYGYDILLNITQGRRWNATGVFPRSTWCDLRRRAVGNVLLRSFPCVLPANMMNEKIYIFLWFWVVFLFLVTGYSIIPWLCRILVSKNQKALIIKYLKIADTDYKDLGEADTKSFIHNYLGWDVAFILRMIEINAGELITSEIVSNMYKIWMGKKDELTLKHSNRTPSIESQIRRNLINNDQHWV